MSKMEKSVGNPHRLFHTGKLADIFSEVGHPVYDEEYDLSKPASPYGIAGWLNRGDKVVLYDRYDMWVVDLAGDSPFSSLTGEWGRKN